MVRRVLPQYVMRSGKYLYFRKDGNLTRLPDDPASTEFAREYARLRSGHATTKGKRTVKALIAHYLKSPKWAKLKPATKDSYRRSFRYFEERIGTLDPATLRPSHIIDMQHALADKPTTANRHLAALSVLMTYAMVRLEWITRNPCQRVEKLATKKPPRKPWPQDLVDVARATADDKTLLVFELLIGTGQRVGDVLKMQWGHISDGGITVKQGKTGAEIFVPFTARLQSVLDATPKRGLYIVTNRSGGALSYHVAWLRIMALRKTIGADAYDIHALRHSAASEIASIPGMTSEHVQAITGHTSAAMVRLYAGAAQQKARAKEAQKGRK